MRIRRDADARTSVGDPLSAVIVRLPGGLSSDGIEVAVRREDWGIEVDCRPAGTSQVWTPVEMVGGSFEERP